MVWTTPKTWAVDELLTAAALNEQLRDNLNALKTPPTAHYECDEASDYTTTNTAFEAVDATRLALTITTTGGDVLVGMVANIAVSTTARVYFNLAVDGVDVAAGDGIVLVTAGITIEPVSFTYLIAGLSAGEHTITLRWKTGAGTATLYAGAGASGADLHPQFWVREVS